MFSILYKQQIFYLLKQYSGAKKKVNLKATHYFGGGLQLNCLNIWNWWKWTVGFFTSVSLRHLCIREGGIITVKNCLLLPLRLTPPSHELPPVPCPLLLQPEERKHWQINWHINVIQEFKKIFQHFCPHEYCLYFSKLIERNFFFLLVPVQRNLKKFLMYIAGYWL